MTQANMGLIGTGTMGSALALNIAENGYDIAIWNLDLSAVDSLIASAGDLAPHLARCDNCLLYTSPSPRDVEESRMPSSA